MTRIAQIGERRLLACWFRLLAETNFLVRTARNAGTFSSLASWFRKAFFRLFHHDVYCAIALTKLRGFGVPTPVTLSQPTAVLRDESVPNVITAHEVEDGSLYRALK